MQDVPGSRRSVKAFENWLETYVDEWGLDREQVFEVEGPSGPNFIPLGAVIDHMLAASARKQVAIKSMIVKLDFFNRDVRIFFRHLAKALAI